MMTSTIRFPVVKETAIGAATVQAVEGRELHGALGVGRDFSNWVKSRITQLGLEENVDYIRYEDLDAPTLASGDFCSPVLASKRGGQNRLDYALTLHAAKHMAMVEKNETGRQVRNYFIECEREAIEGRQALPPRSRYDDLPHSAKTDLLDRMKEAGGLDGLRQGIAVLFPDLALPGWGAETPPHRAPEPNGVTSTTAPEVVARTGENLMLIPPSGALACLRCLLSYRIAGETIRDLMRRAWQDGAAAKRLLTFSIRPYVHEGATGFIIWTSGRKLRRQVYSGTAWAGDSWIDVLPQLPGAAGFDLLAHANSKVATRGQLFLPASLLD